jgi:protein involved in polysaccharide export with SLBB domain
MSRNDQNRFRVSILALILAFAGQATSARPWGTGGRQESPSRQDAEQVDQAPSNQPEEEAYVLQRGDDVEIKVYNIPELNQGLRIRPDGRISLLLLNDVEAAGLTPTALGAKIGELYSDHFRNPRVAVIVRSFANQNIFVGGEVYQPQMISLQGRLTAAAAVFRAGGVKNTAKLKEVILLRDSGKGTPVIRKVNLQAVLTKGEPDVVLKPFDVVYVPKTTIAKVDQFVDQYIKQLLPLTLTVGFTYLLGGQAVIVP